MLNFTKLIYTKKIKNCNNILIDIDKEKSFITNLTKHDNTNLSNRDTLLLMCILSSIVYEYKHENNEIYKDKDKHTHTEISKTVRDPVEIINTEMDQILTDICSKCNIYNDNFNIYNIDNILIFGIFVVNEKLIISFKGSSDINDFISDIQFNTVNAIVEDIIIQGKVHQGAFNILFENNRYKFILDKINEFSKKKYNEIYITGHSLGALTGTIFYSFIQKLWYTEPEKFHIPKDKCKLVTFGSPRPGDKTFCSNINDSIRVVNSSDLVTMIPLPINYSHTKKEFHIGIKKKNCLGISNPSIKDHNINNYFDSLLDIN